MNEQTRSGSYQELQDILDEAPVALRTSLRTGSLLRLLRGGGRRRDHGREEGIHESLAHASEPTPSQMESAEERTNQPSSNTIMIHTTM